MFNLLYLCDQKTYLSKMSRVRFHGMEAVGKLTNLKWSGPGWEGYNNSRSVQENIDVLFPGQQFDLVVAYKPLEMKNFSNVKFLKCIRYNEMYDKNWTIKEITQSKANLVICHHHNDFVEYKNIFKNFSLFPIKFFNVPHSAEKTVFKDYDFSKKYDLMLVGAVGV